MPVVMTPKAATLPLLLVAGEWDEAGNLATLTRVEGSPLERQMATTLLGYILCHQGDTESAWEMVREILPRGSASQPEDALFPYAMETIRLATRLALESGDLDGAREWLTTHDHWLSWSNAWRDQAKGSTLHSAIQLAVGNLIDAEHCARTAIEQASQPRQPLALLDAELHLGRVLFASKRYEEAEPHLNNALTLAKSCAAPYEIALCEIELARLARERGEAPTIVTELLERARSRADRLQASPLLQQINRLRTSSDNRDELLQLTAREYEVLRFIAQGMTDAEAAEQLFISPRTVSQHLRSIYSKFGVSSRAAATRRAMEHGLV